MGDEKKREPLASGKGETSTKTSYDTRERSVSKTVSQKGGTETTSERKSEHKESKTSTKVTVASKNYLGEDKKGAWKSFKSEDGKSELDFFYGKAEAKSEISYDLSKKEAELTPIKAEVQGSVVHGKAEGDFDIGTWFAGLFEKKKPVESGTGTPGSSGAGPYAARVGDPTAHGTPLSPGMGSPNVYIGGQPAWRTGLDLHACAWHGPGTVLTGAPTVLINAMMACRMGDQISEPFGGPDPIGMGCPTVMIGEMSSNGGGPDKKDDNPLKGTGKAEGDFLTGKAEAELSLKASKDEVSATAKAGAMAAVLKGSLEGTLSIPIPFTSHSISLTGKVEGTLLSAGAEAQAGAGWSKDKGAFVSAGAKAGVGLGGVGAGFSIGFK